METGNPPKTFDFKNIRDMTHIDMNVCGTQCVVYCHYFVWQLSVATLSPTLLLCSSTMHQTTVAG